MGSRGTGLGECCWRSINLGTARLGQDSWGSLGRGSREEPSSSTPKLAGTGGGPGARGSGGEVSGAPGAGLAASPLPHWSARSVKAASFM